jgi:sporulation protein YlmC with PRC-barrel domain
MLLLTRLLGRTVHIREGTAVGRLRDVSVRADREHPLISRLIITNRRQPAQLVPWEQVVRLNVDGVWLAGQGLPTNTDDAFDRHLLADELLLRRDLLDTQIIDTNKIRTARVSEVFLNQLPDGRLELAAVDVGLGAVFRRLGLPLRLSEQVVDVRDLHLTSGRGHSIQLETTSAAMHQLDARGLAELLTRLDVERATEVLEVVGPQRAARALEQTHPLVGTRLMVALSQEVADRVINELPRERASHFRKARGSATTLKDRRLFRHRGWRLHRPPDPPSAPTGLK